jgi:hypothetical protein
MKKTETAAAESEIKVIGVPFTKNAFTHHAKENYLTLNYFLGKFDKGQIAFNFELLQGYYKSLGYYYDLKPHLKRFIVWQHGNLAEYFAPNKAILRNCIEGKISEIQEIRNPHLGTQNSVSK